ncbi:MAG: LlsX family protein [Peptoniphilus sp.]|nr:LlsX family protein [Peptoniphilus sp.]MDD7362679.1 LlsX family protein [Bacillota bacterium]MDY6044922.1 LlsX family protein [Peptoniphilus sp.]
MKKSRRILLAMAIGFAVAMVAMAIAIYFGYAGAYDRGGSGRDVYLFGIAIYRLSLSKGRYIGRSIGPNMGMVCAIFMVLAVALEEIVHKFRKR